jgi:hypothetical protein
MNYFAFLLPLPFIKEFVLNAMILTLMNSHHLSNTLVLNQKSCTFTFQCLLIHYYLSSSPTILSCVYLSFSISYNSNQTYMIPLNDHSKCCYRFPFGSQTFTHLTSWLLIQTLSQTPGLLSNMYLSAIVKDLLSFKISN